MVLKDDKFWSSPGRTLGLDVLSREDGMFFVPYLDCRSTSSWSCSCDRPDVLDGMKLQSLLTPGRQWYLLVLNDYCFCVPSLGTGPPLRAIGVPVPCGSTPEDGWGRDEVPLGTTESQPSVLPTVRLIFFIFFLYVLFCVKVYCLSLPRFPYIGPFTVSNNGPLPPRNTSLPTGFP